ncbi:hypothetical protein DV702_00150 [Sporosarcina sp. PTS2304]|uniref:hypothetical protein n=1 Tax=Sporosarcina sp. PTS2304 TaxID=2283194 RepID=UPI000E0CE4F4|nr:hypothetical protein [Sporosarcina sp. PTS2304]AXH98247.1 hypothetical protein DV702_00150 [Sporosarcina sp. PTS2304]
MKLDFIKASPSKNTTVFITNYVAPTHYAKIASGIMDDEHLHAEQAGFLVTPKDSNAVLRLEMSGGEFCGNAVLSAAAYCAYKGLTKDRTFLLEASGCDLPLECVVDEKSPTHFVARAEMPSPLSTTEIIIDVNGQNVTGNVVKLDGITHFLTDYWPTENQFNQLIEAVTHQIKDKAIGIIPYKQLKENEYEIWPFVYVTETGSKLFEQACGSGSLALGIHLSKGNQKNTLHIHQPGGIVHVETGGKNFISTDVRFTCEGFVYLDM